MSEENISDLFETSSEPVSKVETSEAETVEAALELESKAEPEAKVEEEAPKAKEVTTTSEEDKERNQWTFHAVKDERSKRQAIEKEFADYKASMEKKEDTPLPDVIDDQEGFVKSMQDRFDQELARNRIEIYRQVQTEQFPDYPEKEAAFIELAKQNPILVTQMNQAANPAKFVYDQMNKLEEFEKSKDVDSYKEQLKAELRKELMEEMQSKKTEEVEKSDNLSPSLAKARGSTEATEKLSENPSDFFN